MSTAIYTPVDPLRRLARATIVRPGASPARAVAVLRDAVMENTLDRLAPPEVRSDLR
ncbi:hypothetical protein [Salipiger aestuarii]|uniref:Uncharacterized protein n=1 Tax=Salipiger aestuarii TaxID=568098 RepID=A0A327YKG0_9RHOB|nr:hypothetical protein [Salipiger aestuarii]EIE51959.1 hypothetical protein C357_06177 [Citreicella sp. 357]RAK18769.1 hypothetical protein ATI53_101147 [Salipiger aestuarii]